MGDVTVILDAVVRGDRRATEELIPAVYEELRHLAARQLSKESSHQTIQATELVHEAYLRLLGNQAQTWEGRRHFFGAAAEAMRRILIERARRRKSAKHGGHLRRTHLIEIPFPMPSESLLTLDEALNQLSRDDPQAAELVKLRFFAGLTHTHAAEVLGLTRHQADQVWAFARAWLHEAIQPKY